MQDSVFSLHVSIAIYCYFDLKLSVLVAGLAPKSYSDASENKTKKSVCIVSI